MRRRCELEQLGAGRDAERLGLVDRGGPDGRARARGAVAVSPRERPSSDRLISVFGGSASASPLTNEPRPRALDQPVGDELLERAADGGPADAQLVAQPALRGQPVARAAARRPRSPSRSRGRRGDRAAGTPGRSACCGPHYSSVVVACQAVWSALVARGTFRSMEFQETGLWADVREMPGRAGRHPRRRATGIAEAAALLRDDGVRRIVATGNGAAYYVAHALWLASLESGGGRAADRRGAVRRRRRASAFRWRAGRRRPRGLLVGRVPRRGRDRRRAARGARPCVAITADATSSLAEAATATVLQHVDAPARGHPHAGALRAPTPPALGAVGRRSPTTPSSAVVAARAGTPPRARSARPRHGRSEALPALGAPPAAVVAGGGAALGRARSSRADAQGDRADPGRGRRDARGRDVGDVRPRARAT